MNYQDFFKRLENSSMETCFYSNNTGITIEKLYRAFKARLMDEKELKELRRELQVLRDRVDGFATHHDMFGPK